MENADGDEEHPGEGKPDVVPVEKAADEAGFVVDCFEGVGDGGGAADQAAAIGKNDDGAENQAAAEEGECREDDDFGDIVLLWGWPDFIIAENCQQDYDSDEKQNLENTGELLSPAIHSDKFDQFGEKGGLADEVVEKVAETVGGKSGDVAADDDFQGVLAANYKTISRDNGQKDDDEEIPG